MITDRSNSGDYSEKEKDRKYREQKSSSSNTKRDKEQNGSRSKPDDTSKNKQEIIKNDHKSRESSTKSQQEDNIHKKHSLPVSIPLTWFNRLPESKANINRQIMEEVDRIVKYPVLLGRKKVVPASSTTVSGDLPNINDTIKPSSTAELNSTTNITQQGIYKSPTPNDVSDSSNGTTNAVNWRKKLEEGKLPLLLKRKQDSAINITDLTSNKTLQDTNKRYRQSSESEKYKAMQKIAPGINNAYNRNKHVTKGIDKSAQTEAAIVIHGKEISIQKAINESTLATILNGHKSFLPISENSYTKSFVSRVINAVINYVKNSNILEHNQKNRIDFNTLIRVLNAVITDDLMTTDSRPVTNEDGDSAITINANDPRLKQGAAQIAQQQSQQQKNDLEIPTENNISTLDTNSLQQYPYYYGGHISPVDNYGRITQQYAPITQHYAPIPQQYAPVSQQYATIPQQYAPIAQQYAPIVQQYAPIPQQYATQNAVALYSPQMAQMNTEKNYYTQTKQFRNFPRWQPRPYEKSYNDSNRFGKIRRQPPQ